MAEGEKEINCRSRSSEAGKLTVSSRVFGTSTTWALVSARRRAYTRLESLVGLRPNWTRWGALVPMANATSNSGASKP